MRLKTRPNLFFGSILLFIFINATNGASLESQEGDEDLDSLIDEFLTETQELSKQSKSMDSATQTQGDNVIALNAQSKFFKNSKCNCTKFYMCDVEEKSTTVGSDESESEDSSEGVDISVINIRLNVPADACPHYLEICCDKIKQNAALSVPPKRKTKEQKCGKRNIGGVGFRITDGKDGEAQFGEFSWMAALTEIIPPIYPDDNPKTKFVCGASLIHPRAILTAAHCLKNKTASRLSVRLGEWDTMTNSEIYLHQDVNVEKIIMHEKYPVKRTIKNDIAIAILEKEVELGSHISPICLPPAGINLDGVRCFASGWGKDEYGQEGRYQSILKRVDLPIVPRDQCEKAFQTTRLGSNFRLDDSFVCAGGEPKKDTCKGDGGSPLVCQMPGTDYYVQYGIVSWGMSCGLSIPAAYVNVPKFTDWIEEKLAEAGLSIK